MKLTRLIMEMKTIDYRILDSFDCNSSLVSVVYAQYQSGFTLPLALNIIYGLT